MRDPQFEHSRKVSARPNDWSFVRLLVLTIRHQVSQQAWDDQKEENGQKKLDTTDLAHARSEQVQRLWLQGVAVWST